MKPSIFLKKAHDYLTDRNYRIIFNAHRGFYNKMEDKEYLKLLYRALMHKELNLENPITFTEKLQWLKLYDRRPEYTTMVDKYLAKEYIASIVGNEYIIPTLGVWNHFDEINFNKLPNQFVLKCTHDSGGLVICKDKKTLDKKFAKKKIETCLKYNYFYCNREWPYKNVTPRIIAEKYMEDSSTADLKDYKFFCFNGEPKFLYVATGSSEGDAEKESFLDLNWNYTSFKRKDYPEHEEKPCKPISFNKMIEVSRLLSKNLPFIRVDFYEINGILYCGELTITPAAGYMHFIPKTADIEIGSYLTLPKYN